MVKRDTPVPTLKLNTKESLRSFLCQMSQMAVGDSYFCDGIQCSVCVFGTNVLEQTSKDFYEREVIKLIERSK